MNEEESKSFELIDHYLSLERYEQVVELIKEEINEQFNNAYLWFKLGYSNYCLSEYDEAEEQLTEAMRLGYDEDVILFFLGHVYLETERWQESEKAFLDALSISPNDGETLAGYALLMKKTGHKKKSKMLINKAIELEPENELVIRLHYLLEVVNQDRAQQIYALEHYMNAADSELAKVIQLGLDATFRNKVKEAREYFRQAFLMKPEDKNLLLLLEEIEIASHPLMAPNRLVDKLGGPVVFWIIGVGVLMLLRFLGYEKTSIVWALCYGSFAIYTWLSEPLVKIIRKIKG